MVKCGFKCFDPVGDWFVMTNTSGSQVFLLDHHVYDLYDGWKNPNHLVAWALRSALVDEHELAVADIMNAWELRDDKVEIDALKRIYAGVTPYISFNYYDILGLVSIV